MKLAPDLFVWHYTESAARTEHYVDVLFATTLHGLRYDDRKFIAGAILFGEN